MDKIKIAFICVHNSCRSQMAEAICRLKYSNIFEAYSAGTELAKQINKDAVRLINERYGVDMTKTQYPKLIESLPKIDVVITMGCEVACPIIDASHFEDWGLEDPTNKSDDEFIKVIEKIDSNLGKLTKILNNNKSI